MLKTAKIFQNGMTLQRGKEICVWGQSDSRTTVNVEIQGQRGSSVAGVGWCVVSYDSGASGFRGRSDAYLYRDRTVAV